MKRLAGLPAEGRDARTGAMLLTTALREDRRSRPKGRTVMASTPVTTYVAGLAPPLREVAERLVEVLDAGLEGRDGVMWHGHPVWMDGKTPVAG